MNKSVYMIFVLSILWYRAVEAENCTISCDDFPEYCFNSGTCYLDKTTCQYRCYCSPSYSGQRCEHTMTTTTLRPLSERECIPGLPCIHGYCGKDGSSFSCMCDLGWSGVFCENFQCPINCPSTAECVNVNSGFECKEIATTNLPFTNPTEVQNLTTTTSLPTTTLRPLSERECIPGFQCIHGFCDKDGSSFSCMCDLGWNGVFCENFQCPINCPSTTECVNVNSGFECKEIATTNLPFTNPTEVQNLTTTTSLPTTTLRPLSERECIPGFQCIHGYCDKDGPSFSCMCDLGWNGVFCENFQCPINCPENAECVNSNGVFECKALVTTNVPLTNKTVSQNLMTTTSLPTTTLRPLSERECIPGFQCIHGFCDKDGSSFSCLCDLGWNGVFCDRFQCPINCPNNADCVIVNDGFECKVKMTTTTQMPVVTTNNLPFTTLRPLSDRQCVPGFECFHGLCEKDESSFYCKCDDGWEGVFCQRFKCPLTCPSNTDCILDGDTFKCKLKTTTAKPPTTPAMGTGSTPLPTANSTGIDACSANYTKRPLSERQCMPNFICEYGVCEMTREDSGSILECVCDDGGLGGLCQDLCCLPCSEFGQCKTFTNGTEFCQCQFNYEGALCESKKIPSTLAPSTEVDLWPLWVSAIVLVCLIGAAAILFFWMWQNRVTIVMKIVHYFQAYEDDDEKTWDAFVSYKSADIDQKFVLKKLFPKLEKELGFTLCLHHRDFLPGETIANNIINAIDNSRRTILILTPRYVSSEFTRFEYQVAQHEMMKRKHRIIPILLEDISDVTDNMDPNLKQIIKSVTYLEYPGDDSTEKKINHFWKKLSLSMPKKRATEERQKQQKENANEKQKKDMDNIDKYDVNDLNPAFVEEKLDKNGLGNPTFINVDETLGNKGLGNPAFVTDVAVTVVDEQKSYENENDFINNRNRVNITEWTHL